eukprot:Skav201310  [mRNA]  locus=scaffold1490:85453:99353:- [translate_table: standard]
MRSQGSTRGELIRDYQPAAGSSWRFGLPDYAKVNKTYFQHRTMAHHEGSLEALATWFNLVNVQKIVKNWQVEADNIADVHKWTTMDSAKFKAGACPKTLTPLRREELVEAQLHSHSCGFVEPPARPLGSADGRDPPKTACEVSVSRRKGTLAKARAKGGERRRKEDRKRRKTSEAEEIRGDAMEVLGVTAYQYSKLPIEPSPDGWAVVVDGAARKKALISRSGSDKSYVATGGVAQKQGRGVPAVSKSKTRRKRNVWEAAKTLLRETAPPLAKEPTEDGNLDVFGRRGLPHVDI